MNAPSSDCTKKEIRSVICFLHSEVVKPENIRRMHHDMVRVVKSKQDCGRVITYFLNTFPKALGSNPGFEMEAFVSC